MGAVHTLRVKSPYQLLNIENIKIENKHCLEIQAPTSSFELAIKEKSRSFQDVNMTYDELIGIIIKDFLGYRYEYWSFFKWISSELKSELSCDRIETLNMVYLVF
ncbi:hypothetical protein [Clostridium estertheticum]|uniref:hypothetical protein n=1 Tax=Clostridium estertheticum TaxID=238834 RepID=UPI00299D8FBD|nr:hypothetical protein [Clostridium estertheticum]